MSRDTNFYYSFLVLPPDKRRAIVAVWDFCRAVDDAVDEAGAGEPARQQVSRWRTELAAVFDGRTPQTPQGLRLAPFVGEFHLPRPAFEALIEGVEMDLDSRRYESFEDLYEYCIRVASAVGLICLEIFGYSDTRSRQRDGSRRRVAAHEHPAGCPGRSRAWTRLHSAVRSSGARMFGRGPQARSGGGGNGCGRPG
jgi:phytoene/squalene synthetase